MDPLQQAAEQLLRAAGLMERVEEQRHDEVAAAHSAGWDMLGQRAAAYDQRSALQGRTALYATPAGGQLLAGQAALGAGNALLQARAAVAESRARAAHMDSPQGQAETLQAARLHLEQQELQQGLARRGQLAREQVAREQSIQQYGHLGVAAGNLGRSLLAVGPAVAAGRALFAQAVGLAGQASPNTQATYQASAATLQARLGTYLVPAVEAAAVRLQHFGRLLDAIPWPIRRFSGRLLEMSLQAGPGDVMGNLRQPYTVMRNIEETTGIDIRGRLRAGREADRAAGGWRARLADSWVSRAAAWSLGLDGQQDPDRSGRGLAAPSLGTGADYWHRAQMEVLGQGPEDLKRLAEQMENLARTLEGSLTQIAENTAPLRQSFPAFR